MNDTLIGKIIGKYEIIEKLGRGGMAEVYKGYQKNLDRHVAIKLMHSFLISEQDFLKRFQQEARAMAALNHPNIVGVYDFDQYKEDTYYLVMEFVDGGTLKDKLETLAQNKERLPLETSIRIVREVADALAYAHRRNMVHRDIKPANIMLDKDSGRALLTDFGIVKLVGGQTMGYTATGALIGTPSYMSPEQALGQSGDERADIYSLGVLLFQMMTGQLPYEADTPLAVVMKHVNSPTPMPVTFNPDIPEALQAVIVKSMAKNPDDRYATAVELAAALREIDLSAPPPKKVDNFSTIAATQLVPLEIAELDKPVQMPPTPQPTAVSQPPVSQPPVSQPTAVSEPPVSQPPAQPIKLTTQPSASAKKRSPWLYAGIAAVLILIVVGGIFALNGRNTDPTPTISAIVEAADTATSKPPTETAVPDETPDVVATAVAAISLTETAKPTGTAVPTKASTSTQTPTPDATLDFLANCTLDVELVNSYAYQTQSSSFAPVGATFPMSWILRNSGTCLWPAGSQWVYVDGDELGYNEPTTLDNDVPSGSEIRLTTNLKAPTTANEYESRWQLVDNNGSIIGGPISFSITAYIPPTATPKATNTPVASPTPEPSEITELNYAFEILNCEYVGSDWRCRVRLTPYGGGGGPYTMFIFLNPIVELRDQFYYDYFVQARRCAAWNTEIKVIDEATSLEFSRSLYVDPDNYIAGGCTEP